MYHHIGDLPPDADAVRRDLTVPADVFDGQMKYLSDKGFHTVHLVDVVNHLRSGAPLPEKPIVITFDDGYDDNYLNAFPTLKDHGFSGTFFVITGRADNQSAGYLTWSQIEEMAANGMEIGSHTLDHRFNLGAFPRSLQWNEIKPAYDALAQHLPGGPLVFAYPSGSYNATTISILHELGYTAAVTTITGVVQSSATPLQLKRIRIRGKWSVGDFEFWVDYWSRGS
jgi:peptidoglycan/xylan/chitin deacetylase (PgdA/CDA1 family)